ncbi:DNA-binding transcriptional regulator RamA [Erwinia sp. OLTSP20]|uniref:RamA family antibiotic efflux transcriptional regulator n=1 Tax=unclassified Erwinia TaxID=2622719 RepID=UPI000C1957F4|nr:MULTISPECIES: RamA family antibiotic efflux transcriptional regulator [unclassified Erwinia]PIJ51720.1 DNA-binding transcriptional regulator RamA [Erwinia sp. OAMSP11]PIJ75607.1 DNA-binding transcriptional regulator RamA [Erwinia sp. OLSSP12]PIJ84912.1 DNA-binding transcriptional regulator RamA [Erwinia sp. OLCASP19]PIJ86691.1 DNA-binding transcriptional regulator RamA [Erwinia sp. OLMTSP26]PIJ88132.1 DNA-binding transcriptional regulator RamA [Erwinia sp. OLMDSP33]
MNISGQVIETLVDWIDQHLDQPLKIDDVARHSGYSKWHLQRLFMQHQGEPLGSYIRNRKLSLAAADLRNTDDRVFDICLKYGFDSQQTFTRIFSRIYHQPPAAYRRAFHHKTNMQRAS